MWIRKERYQMQTLAHQVETMEGEEIWVSAAKD